MQPGVVSLQKISRETTKTRKNVVSLPFSSRETTLQGIEGYYMIEITWHNVRAIECENIQCLDQITKGSKVYILGRLLSRRYTDADGKERSAIDIIAHEVKILD